MSLALFLYALLEHHGYFVVPAMAIAKSKLAEPSDRFVAQVRTNLRIKLDRTRESHLPRNAAYHAMETELRRHAAEWGLEITSSSSNAIRHRQLISPKTLASYYGRTLSYFEEVQLLVRGGSNKGSISFTESGERFLACLRTVGFGNGGSTEVPPSFETVHDAFSLDKERYEDAFRPSVSQAIFESVIRSTLLPSHPPSSWRGDEARLKELYPRALIAASERLTNAARLDVVRLSLFAYTIGAARPIVFEDDGGDLNDNAVVEIARQDPSNYLLGHARSGQRFWSVALMRR